MTPCPHENTEEHRVLVEALATRDPALSRRLSQEHIQSAENSLMSLLAAEEKKGKRNK